MHQPRLLLGCSQSVEMLLPPAVTAPEECLGSRSQSTYWQMTMLELTFLGRECVSPAYLYWLSLDCYRLLMRNPPSGINQKLASVWVFFLSEDADLNDFIEIYLHCQNYLYPKPGKKLFEK